MELCTDKILAGATSEMTGQTTAPSESRFKGETLSDTRKSEVQKKGAIWGTRWGGLPMASQSAAHTETLKPGLFPPWSSAFFWMGVQVSTPYECALWPWVSNWISLSWGFLSTTWQGAGGNQLCGHLGSGDPGICGDSVLGGMLRSGQKPLQETILGPNHFYFGAIRVTLDASSPWVSVSLLARQGFK